MRKRKKRKKIILTLLISAVLIPLVLGTLAFCGFSIWANLQHIDKSLLPTASATPEYYDLSGNVLPYSKSLFIERDEISDDLKHAFVALEDKRFYKHRGFDLMRIAGAAIKNLKAGKLSEGASTITQQLIKNTHLTQKRTISRKLKELALAIDLERQYSKDEILSMYLSVIYFGGGAYGVKSAADLYFGKPISDLTLSECATLAGLVKNPAGYSPLNHPEECKKRRNIALSVMLSEGYIDKEAFDNVKDMPVITVDRSTANLSASSAKCFEGYISQARAEACELLKITKYQLDNSGLKIYTNLDTSLQFALENERLSSDNRAASNVSSVSVVLDNATGAVIAYSSDYPFAVYRQAGSVLKPLAVYAPALDKGLISLATPITDEKVDFGGYSPSNYGGVYYGDTTVREAIKKSMNSVSVKVLDYLGTDESVGYLSRLGISTLDEDKSYALALGATQNGVSPIDVAGAYCTLARGGMYLKPSFVNCITDKDGSVLYRRDVATKNRIFSGATSALMTRALIDTVKDGTAKTLAALPFEVAAKTGTAERTDIGNSDAWNASYSDRYTVVVWHGSDSGMTEKGGGYPTRHAYKIWRALDGLKPIDRSMTLPSEIERCEIDIYSTRQNKHVVSATENTPLEYRKAEYFPINNLPNSTGSRFDKVAAPKLSINSVGGTVSVKFDSESIYLYELYRTDVTGTKTLYIGRGTGGFVDLLDRPIAFGGKVDYTLVCHLSGNDEIRSAVTKSVYMKDALN